MCVACRVMRLYSLVDIGVLSGDMYCCSVVCDTLAGVSVFSIICSGWLLKSEIS